MMPSNWLTVLITLLAGAVGTIYTFQVIWPRVKGLLTATPGARTRQAKMRYQAALVEENVREEITQIILKPIRSVQQDREIICLFLNEGGSVLNLSVEAESGVSGSIEPADLLEAGQTGGIRLRLPTTYEFDEVAFTVRYQDRSGRPGRAAYLYQMKKQALVPREPASDH
jgi:hypothetical protein